MSVGFVGRPSLPSAKTRRMGRPARGSWRRGSSGRGRSLRAARRVFGKKLLPVFAGGLRDGCADEAELLGIVVGADVEEAVAMVDVVLLVVDAWGDELEGGLGCGGAEEPGFVGGVAAGFEEDVFAVAGAADAEVEALVVPHERSQTAADAELHAEGAVLALGLLVFGGEEEGGGVGGPDDGADAFGGVGEFDAGGEVADVQGVLAEAGVVRGVGEQTAVRG